MTTSHRSSFVPASLALLLVAGCDECGGFSVHTACEESGPTRCLRFDPNQYVLEDDAGGRHVLTSSGATTVVAGRSYTLAVERIQPSEVLAQLPADPAQPSDVDLDQVRTFSAFELSSLRLGDVEVSEWSVDPKTTKLLEIDLRAEDLVTDADGLVVAASFSATGQVRVGDDDKTASVEARLVRRFLVTVRPDAPAPQPVVVVDAVTPTYGIAGAGSFGCKFPATSFASEAVIETRELNVRCPQFTFACVSTRRSAQSEASASAGGGDLVAELVAVEQALELVCADAEKTACAYCLETPRPSLSELSAQVRVGDRVVSVGPVTIERR
jgi:hypothetical protein